MKKEEAFEVLKGLKTTQHDLQILEALDIAIKELEPKRRCGECKYLNLNNHVSVGYRCSRPDKVRLSSSACYKPKHSIACKAFEER